MFFNLILLVLTNASGQGSNQGSCLEPWKKGSASCYLINTTAVTRQEAWDFCISTEQASLLVIENEAENDLVNVLAEAQNMQDYWTSGTREGWEVPQNGSTSHIDYTDGQGQGFENWLSGSRDAAGWTSTGKNGLQVTSGRFWIMQHTDSSVTAGFVCEIPLDTCYTELEIDRTTWPRTTVDETASTSCPTSPMNYTGSQTRYCTASASFDNPTTQNCAAVITSGGYTDDTHTDGFAWSDQSLHTGSALGPFRAGTSNKKKFHVDADLSEYPYLYIEFTAKGENSWDGMVTVKVNDNEISSMNFTDGSHKYSMSFGRELFSAETEFELEIAGVMDGEDSNSVKGFNVEGLTINPYNRQQMSEDCYRQLAFNESTSHPVFQEANSGFLTTDDDLTIEFTIPRELFDVQIEFVGQQNAKVGYTEANRDDTFWDSDRDTTQAKCGPETWKAAIPWTSLTGAFNSVENFNDGNSVVDNASQDYYVFTSVLNITATEKLVAFSEDTARTWTLTRTATWRYPFALKWLRDVNVETTVDVFVCADGSHICTVRHVTAIVSFIQTEVNPIAGLQQNGIYGKVVLGITTKVAYPYMFVSGRANDDPPNDQISLSNLTDYEHQFSSWNPPGVVPAPDVVDGVQQVVTAAMQFEFENNASCTHDVSQAVEFQTKQECEQSWTMTLTPTGGSCYVSGSYTIQFSARCMYNKPVCNFKKDTGTGKYQNGVSTTLNVKSTQMCPSLVQDVDLTGSLCSTGRAQDSKSYASSCDQDATYVQGETTHFITEISSSLAAIHKTEIIKIYATQDFSTWNTQDAADQGLLPRFDNSYDGKVLLWQEGDNVPAANDFNDGGSAVDAALRQTIVDVANSDDSGESFASTKAGFQVVLNPYIFPSPHDRSTDIVFTVVLRATYVGFNEFDRTTGILSGDSRYGGSEDHSWCAGVLANTYLGATDKFCAEYDDAATYCPDTCARRRLQQTPIESGDDFMQLTTRIKLHPQKAEINGRIDATSSKVRFVLKLEVGQEMLDLFNNDRPLFYRRMEYKLGHIANAIDGQFQVTQITRIQRGKSEALEIVAEISQMQGVDDVKLSVASVASNLEMMIQTGQIYHDAFFTKTEVFSMQYEAVEDHPEKVHFGHATPIKAEVNPQMDSSSGVLSVLAVFLGMLLW